MNCFDMKIQRFNVVIKILEDESRKADEAGKWLEYVYSDRFASGIRLLKDLSNEICELMIIDEQIVSAIINQKAVAC